MDRPPATSPPSQVFDASIALLDQCAAMLAGVEPHHYQRPCPLMSGSTIGQHVRHLLDHFASVITPANAAIIDYDHRERDTPVERHPDAAIALIRVLIGRLRGPRDPARSVRVRLMINAAGEEALLDSSLGRELAFAAHHAVHHHAMIAAIASTMGIVTPESFGRAPSTVHHEHTAREEARLVGSR